MAKGIYPPSVQPGKPKLPPCPSGWRPAKFGDILKEVSRPIKLNNRDEYQLVVAKRSRGGIEPREKLMGAKIKTPSQFIVEAGDFLISKRQIVHGACGIVPERLDGAIVSNEYSVLHPKDDLDMAFLNHYAHSIYFQQTCFHSSVGVDVEKMIFRLHEWFRHKIWLPPIAEQKKIAEILSTWDRTIATLKESNRLRYLERRGIIRRYFSDSVATETVEFDDLYQISNEKTKQIKSDQYLDRGQFPVIDQGQGLICGYCDDESKLITKVPVIVFGDHTREIKFVKFPFVPGADGTQIIRTVETIPIEVGYYSLLGFRLPSMGYSRHFKVLKEGYFYLPKDKSLLPTIVAALAQLDAAIEAENQVIGAVKKQKQGLMQKLLTGKVRVKV